MSFTASLEDIVQENHNGLLSAAEHWERVRLGDVAIIVNGFEQRCSRLLTGAGYQLFESARLRRYKCDRWRGDADLVAFGPEDDSAESAVAQLSGMEY